MLIDVELPLSQAPLPDDVRSFLREAHARMSRYFDHQSAGTSGFVPSDFELAYRALRGIADTNLAPGNLFSEWGSGFGVVTSLASLLDFDAYGIEIEHRLVNAARELAADFSLPAEFVRGSFIPAGDEVLADAECAAHNDGVYFLVTEADEAYDELGLSPADSDVVFAYPWPGEEGAIEAVFEKHASAGALLLTYHGHQNIRLQRKTR